MEEVTGYEKKLERYGSKSSLSILAENSYQFITECFSPFTPLANPKIKFLKPNQNQSFKQFERCEYKITCRPPIQLFKSYYDDKTKKNEEVPAQPQKKLMKTNKMVNKIFQHSPTDSGSLKMYRDLYIYKSLGSVARKNLERAVSIYNANKDEIELARRFTSKKNSNSCKREQPHHKKLMKTETYMRTIKPKTDMKENLTKDLKRSLQGMISNQKKCLQYTDNGRHTYKNINKTNKVELHGIKKDENQVLKEIEISSKVPDTLLKKLVVKNDVKRILPKLSVRPIERKIKEKKQLTLAVLNISLPSLKQFKDETSKDTKAYFDKNTRQNIGLKDYYNKNHSNYDLEEPDELLRTLSNRKRIAHDIRGELNTSNKIKTSKKRSYLLKLPIAKPTRKGLNNSSENINLLTIQEPDKTFTFPLPTNDDLSMLSQHIMKEQNSCNIAEHPPFISEQFEERCRKKQSKLYESIFKNSFQRYTNVETNEFGQFVNIDDQELKMMKNDLSTFRKISLYSKENIYNLKRNELNVI